MKLLLMQAHVAMATADVSIVVLTNQKARRAPATRNMFFVMTYIPARVLYFVLTFMVNKDEYVM